MGDRWLKKGKSERLRNEMPICTFDRITLGDGA